MKMFLTKKRSSSKSSSNDGDKTATATMRAAHDDDTTRTKPVGGHHINNDRVSARSLDDDPFNSDISTIATEFTGNSSVRSSSVLSHRISSSTRQSIGIDSCNSASNHSRRSLQFGRTARTSTTSASSEPCLVTQSHKENARRKLIDFAQSKLDFNRLGLIGREQEQRLLHRALEKCVRGRQTNALPQMQMASCDSSSSHSDEESRGNTAQGGGNGRCFVTLSGHSGTGKSALAATLRPKCIKWHAFYVSGKFDLNQIHEPLSGFKSAMIDLCEQISKLPYGPNATQRTIDAATTSSSQKRNANQDPRRFDQLKDLIVDGLEIKEIQALSTLVPNIVDVVGADLLSGAKEWQSDQAPPNETNTLGYQEQSDCLKFAFRKFVQIICQYSPLVWVSDDVQWADKPSLDMIESWMTDTTISSLMVVACFRSSDHANQIETTNELVTQMLQSIERSKQERSIRTVEIRMRNLQLEHVNAMLNRLLDLPDDRQAQEISGLAKIVHRRTDGNIFFIQHFLRMLIHEELLRYDVSRLQWKWNIDDVNAGTLATVNVVQLMQAKLQRIHDAGLVLPVAACLGSTFSWSLLRTTMQGFLRDPQQRQFYASAFQDSPPQDDVALMRILITCQEEGMIDCVDASRETSSLRDLMAANPNFAFVHDKVQEVALNMIPSTETLEFQYRAGQILLSGLGAAEFEQHLFTVVNLLNVGIDSMLQGQKHDTNDVHDMSKLNYRAGVKAASCSGFQAALVYFKNAIKLLPPGSWQTDYETTLDLHSSVTECALVCHEHADFQKHADIIISRDCPILDKMRVYHLMMAASTASGDHKRASDATEMGRTVLSEFGVRFPKNRIHQTVRSIEGLLKVSRAAKEKFTPTALQSLPRCDDPQQCAIIKSLDQMASAAYLTDPNLMPLVLLKSITLTRKNGVTSFAPVSFVVLGLIMSSVLGQVEDGRACAEGAIAMARKPENQVAECRVLQVSHGLIFHYSQPYKDSKEPLLRSYTIGMAAGNTDCAIWSMYFYLDICWYTGSKLDAMDQDLATYTRMAKDFRQTKHSDAFALLWQLVLNLRGMSKNPLLLVGDAFNEAEALPRYKTTNDGMFVAMCYRSKMYAAVYFGDFELGARIAADNLQSHMSFCSGQIGFLPFIFFASFSCYIAASRNTTTMPFAENKELRLARRYRRVLEKWVKKGNPNCAHYVALLDAERALRKARRQRKVAGFDIAVQHYQNAIRLAARRGLIQDQALANERLADYWSERGDVENANHHFEQAIRLYEEWNADGKVEMLRKRRQNEWKPPVEIEVEVME